MNYTDITSRNNEKIKYAAKLISSAKQRKQDALFVCEGVRLCCDAFSSGYEIVDCFVTEEALVKHGDKMSNMLDGAKALYRISEEVAQKLSDTVSSQGVFCVVKMREEHSKVFNFIKGEKYVALENLQNPQNLGAIARTAEALGIKAVLTYSGCDIYNPKALRASMGSLLRIPVYQVSSLEDSLKEAQNNGIYTFVTVPDETARDITELDFSCGALAVIGNEGNGVSSGITQAAKNRVTIKMKGEAESLNASVAAVITMWEMMR